MPGSRKPKPGDHEDHDHKYENENHEGITYHSPQRRQRRGRSERRAVTFLSDAMVDDVTMVIYRLS